MSDFKIIGNPNPVIGVTETYSVNNFFQKILPYHDLATSKINSSELPVHWEVYILEFGKWRKTKENDKTGNKVTYKFKQKSLDRKGIRLVAKKGDEVANLDIKSQPAERPKIDYVELLDKSGKKITGRLSYGQTVKARVHCFHMERYRVFVTLWEDDVNGAGHDKANEKNIVKMLSGIVKYGKVDIDFLLSPSFSKIATKGGPENDKIHEYYVTAEYNNEKIPSNNVNVNAGETPIATYKGKTKQPVKAVPIQNPKGNAAKSNIPIIAAPVKSKINSVNITDTSGRAIKGIFKDKQIKVWINSSNLIGNEVRLKLFDDDYGKDDLLFHQEFTIKSDLYAIVIPLDTIPRSWGGNFLEEGNEQELFAEVEVLQTHTFTKSVIVDVNATVFKQDPVEVSNNVLKIDVPKVEKNEKGTCVCKEYDLVWGNKISCEQRKKVITVAANLGVKPNWLMAVIGLETAKTFSPSIDNGIGYVGLVQFGQDAAKTVKTTQQKLVKMTFVEQMDYVQKFLIGKKDKYKTLVDLYLAVLYPNACGHGGEKDYIVLKDKAYRNNPLFFQEEDEITKDKKGKIISRHPKANGHTFVWEVDLAIQSVLSQGLSNKTKSFKCEVNTGTKNRSNCKCTKTHIDLRSTVKWHSQFDSQWGDKKAQNVACWKASQQILTNSGLDSTSGYPAGAIQMAREVDKHTKIEYLADGLKAGIKYIDEQLEKYNPILVGVNHDLNYHGEKNNDHTTDHFVVIVGRDCDDNGAFYIFYEVGTQYKKLGSSDDNKLYILSNRIEGKTAYSLTKLYQVAQVRKNNQ